MSAMASGDDFNSRKEYKVVLQDRRDGQTITRLIKKVKNPDDACGEMRDQITAEFNITEEEYDKHYRVKYCRRETDCY
jgi:hypothetical protein